jgi:hypothetical protein
LPATEQPAYHRWKLASGDDWIRFHRTGDAYVLCFPELARFLVSADGRQVHCHAPRKVPDTTIRHLFWNSVLPFAANAQGATVLHGGAVELDEHAVAFLGATGRGKSTLTAALAAGGYRFLTDDALRVGLSASGQALAGPGQAHVRLWHDSERVLAGCATRGEDAAAKSRVLAGDRFPHCPVERPLCAIYLLGDGGSPVPRFEPVRPAAALLELVQNAFLLDPESPQLLKVQHATLSALVTTVPIFRMHFARSYDSLAAVCRDTVAHARANRRSA